MQGLLCCATLVSCFPSFLLSLCRYDLLLRYRLHIVGETSLAINHCLAALPGTKAENIKRVMSHPQVRAQADGRAAYSSRW